MEGPTERLLIGIVVTVVGGVILYFVTQSLEQKSTLPDLESVRVERPQIPRTSAETLEVAGIAPDVSQIPTQPSTVQIHGRWTNLGTSCRFAWTVFQDEETIRMIDADGLELGSYTIEVADAHSIRVRGSEGTALFTLRGDRLRYREGSSDTEFSAC